MISPPFLHYQHVRLGSDKKVESTVHPGLYSISRISYPDLKGIFIFLELEYIYRFPSSNQGCGLLASSTGKWAVHQKLLLGAVRLSGSWRGERAWTEEMWGMKSQGMMDADTWSGRCLDLQQPHHGSVSSQGIFCCSKSPEEHQQSPAHEHSCSLLPRKGCHRQTHLNHTVKDLLQVGGSELINTF